MPATELRQVVIAAVLRMTRSRQQPRNLLNALYFLIWRRSMLFLKFSIWIRPLDYPSKPIRGMNTKLVSWR